jgi:hypothetical protein
MTAVRTMPLAALSRGSAAIRRSPINRPLLIAISLFLAVLIAEAVIIAAAAPRIAELGSFYITST